MVQASWNEIHGSLAEELARNSWIAVATAIPPTHASKALQSRSAHLLLRRLLGQALETDPAALELTFGEHGKPALRDPPTSLHFNLSHCSTHVLVAFSNRYEIGVDIEAVGEYKSRVARRILEPDQYLALDRLDNTARAAAFYRYWVIKEACLKATGVGLSTRLRDVRVSTVRAGRWSEIAWELVDIDPDVMACVAVRAPAEQAIRGRLYRIDSLR
jgi:phosphopantetheine--protein transferase-like protein